MQDHQSQDLRGANRGLWGRLPIPRPKTDKVALFYWRPHSRIRRRHNFGDYLSLVIVEGVLRTRNLSLRSPGRPARLLAIGSVLHFAEDGDVIWGSGRNGKIADETHTFQHLDVRAVRGPLTRAYLKTKGIAAPEIYGDPALLLPTLFPAFAEMGRQKRHDYALVPNLHDTRLVAGEPNLVRPTQNWKDCVRRIVQSRFVVASSLHGIIVAEAFGIPARMLRLSDTEPDFKYADYYAGTGRQRFQAARTLEEARDLGGEPAPTVDTHALFEAFPFDLWHHAR